MASKPCLTAEVNVGNVKSCVVYLETTFRSSKATNIKKDAQRSNFTFKVSFEGCDHQFVTHCKLHDVDTVDTPLNW